MRIEFMAPEELKREKDFRVDVQNGIHARACTGGSIAIAESSIYELRGKLPDGADYSASIRVYEAARTRDAQAAGVGRSLPQHSRPG